MPLQVIHEFRSVGPYTGPGLISADSDTALCDRSLSTSVVVSNYIGPSGVIINGVDGLLKEPIEAPGTAALVTSSSPVWARFEANGPIQNVFLETLGTGLESGIDFSRPPVTTARYTYYPMDSSAWDRVNDCGAGYDVLMRVQVPADRENPDHSTTIYEAWIVVAVEIPSETPPCRITGRGDALGRGSGRIVPRPKSQQSGRFRGFY